MFRPYSPLLLGLIFNCCFRLHVRRITFGEKQRKKDPAFLNCFLCFCGKFQDMKFIGKKANLKKYIQETCGNRWNEKFPKMKMDFFLRKAGWLFLRMERI